ncbi:MAG: DUF4185 domain-containing protein [Planctomycetes bacterium]|nr:DUF4185 domain-containing protein [Planctomycetota bacterium]
MLKLSLGTPVMDLNSKGDAWDACWADDGHVYVTSDDSYGFGGQPTRNLHINVLCGETPDALRGETINLMDEYGKMSERGPDGCMWKANGTTCVGGALYTFVSRHEAAAFTDPARRDDSKLQSAANASLIVSTDKGRTWRRTAKENYDAPMFPGRRFGSPFFVKYGRDGQGGVHGADQYVYAIANNGFWENGDDMIVARVPRERIARLDAADWQFLSGTDGLRDADWSDDMLAARPVLVNPGKCSMTGVQYIAPLRRYLMIQWHYPKGSGHAAADETAWIFYEAPVPWGPWTEFGGATFPGAAYYNPCIGTKFISADGFDLVIFTNGNFKTHAKAGADCLYRLTSIPCRLSL